MGCVAFRLSFVHLTSEGTRFPSTTPLTNERNPFLGSRATRFLLKEQEFFKAQLRAILEPVRWASEHPFPHDIDA